MRKIQMWTAAISQNPLWPRLSLELLLHIIINAIIINIGSKCASLFFLKLAIC